MQAYVSRLRKILHTADPVDPPVDVLRRRPGYLLQIDPEMIDLHRFERLLRAGVAVLPAAPSRSAELLREALGLCRGAPLAEFTDQPFARAEIPGYRSSTWPR